MRRAPESGSPFAFPVRAGHARPSTLSRRRPPRRPAATRRVDGSAMKRRSIRRSNASRSKRSSRPATRSRRSSRGVSRPSLRETAVDRSNAGVTGEGADERDVVDRRSTEMRRATPCRSRFDARDVEVRQQVVDPFPVGIRPQIAQYQRDRFVPLIILNDIG